MTDPLPRLTEALSDRYRIERELGQGGMATVYLAQDIRHNRRVAVKVLRPELAAVIGAERFLSEITTTANLQHPHILPLFDSGEADGFLFYVMPYVEGETVRDRISREKQLPVADAVRITTEVASALDYAHRQGVIHRDIKPENILLHDGSALVADFGIALAVSTAGTRMTETGMSLGTPHYMSPEQAMGEREITATSDVYALGCVLYEMLVGEPPFTGPTAQAIIARVVTEEPRSLVIQRKTIPEHIEAAVEQALQKLPADRFTSAAAFAAALSDSTTVMSSTRLTSKRGAPNAVATRRLPAPLMAAAGLLLAALGLAGGWALWHQQPPKFPPIVSKFAQPLPDSMAYFETLADQVVYARDGSVFAYTSQAGIVLRYADRVEPVLAPGARRGTLPFFSPDSRWLGYLEGPRLMKVPLAGGAAVAICDSCPGYAFSWGSDDSVRFYASGIEELQTRQLYVVPAQGGIPRIFATPDSGSGEAFRSPVLLPGERTVLFALFKGRTSRLAALNLDNGVITRFEQVGFSPQWVDRGFVVLGNQDGSLMALPFDAHRARPAGAPVTIARDINQSNAFVTTAGVSASGSIAYPQSGASALRQLMLVSRAGQATPLASEPRAFDNPRFSPDGRRIAVAIRVTDGPGRDVWVFDRAQRSWSRLTTDGLSDLPIWTPDGRRVVYSSNSDLWWIAADGSEQAESLYVANGGRIAGSVTPDGRSVVFQEYSSGNDGIRTLTFDSAPASRMNMPASFNESEVTLSPDGRWLAYQSDEADRMEVYVRPYPGPGGRVSVSLLGGTEPAWSRDGGELYYRTGDSLMAATVSLSPTFAVTGRRALFTGAFLRATNSREYDPAPDGQHFVMIRGGTTQSTLIVINNLFDRLVYEREQKK
jgi:Tol biopolymer transport system component/tRNA A-37 threonylcarbamoyl transferase component Bud32